MTIDEYIDLIGNKIDEGTNFPAYSGGRCVHGEVGSPQCFIGILMPAGHPARKSTLSIDLVLVDFPTLWENMPESLNSYQLEAIQKVHDELAFIGYTTEDYKHKKPLILSLIRQIASRPDHRFDSKEIQQRLGI